MRRFERGEEVTSLGSLQQMMGLGENFIVRGRYAHSGFLVSMKLGTVLKLINGGNVYVAVPVQDPKLWPPVVNERPWLKQGTGRLVGE